MYLITSKQANCCLKQQSTCHFVLNNKRKKIKSWLTVFNHQNASFEAQNLLDYTTCCSFYLYVTGHNPILNRKINFPRAFDVRGLLIFFFYHLTVTVFKKNGTLNQKEVFYFCHCPNLNSFLTQLSLPNKRKRQIVYFSI